MTDTEIDEAVARKLGWVFDDNAEDKAFPWIEPYKSRHTYLPDYSHSIEAAWEIFEFVDSWKLEGFGGDEVLASLVFDDSPVTFSKADTAPMAICKAFLKLDPKCLPL